MSDVFVDLTETTNPIAAASLGQVYKLKLKNGRGEMVAVKVQVHQFSCHGFFFPFFSLKAVDETV